MHPPMEIRRFCSPNPGPRLLVLGCIHGVETCGLYAIRQILDALSRNELTIKAGQATFIPVANPEAFEIHMRYVGRDLNRDFKPLSKPTIAADSYVNAICEMMEDCEVLLDLHSFKARGDAFIVVGPNYDHLSIEPTGLLSEELAFANALGIRRMVYGWLGAYDRFVTNQNELLGRLDESVAQKVRVATKGFGRGTAEYFRSLEGKYGVTVECGNHLEESSITTGVSVIKRAMTFLGLADAIEMETAQSISESFLFSEIFIREHADDRLARPYSSFNRVTAGEPLGYRASGYAVVAPADGAVIWAYDDARVGSEWIYFGENSTVGCS